MYFVGGDINTAKGASMKSTMKFFGLIAMVAVMGLTFAACGGDDDDGGGGGGKISVPETNVQVLNKDGTEYTGSGTIRWRDPTFQDIQDYITIGTVTNGKLTLDLPATVPEKYLNSTYGDAKHTNLFMTSLSLYNGTTSYAGIAYRPETASIGNKEYSIKYVYCTKPISRNTSISNYTYRINADAGWNRILDILTDNDPYYSSVATTDSKDMPSNMKWRLSK
jgi:hypothetical protein